MLAAADRPGCDRALRPATPALSYDLPVYVKRSEGRQGANPTAWLRTLGPVELYFSTHFGVDPDALEAYGALDISLVSDLPLFVDPFLLFNSDDPEFQRLHDGIVEYLKYLRDQAGGELDQGTMLDLYCFAEVKQNWFGFTEFGNGGSGLGPDFARALHKALGGILSDFGEETVTLAATWRR